MGRKVTRFSVQIEVYVENEWKAVVRYDTAHGFAHRDQILPNGKVEKTPIFSHTFNEALDFAEADLKTGWRSYVEKYLTEEKK